MTYGKTVRIFLPNGTTTGIRHAELSNRTGQAIACPRNRLQELNEWPEASKPGVYILFEARLSDSKPKAYIGESENVAARLLNHDREKDFWNEVIIISNKDDNLTKSHVKYLESKIELSAKEADRYILENSIKPTKSSLSRSDQETMAELLEDIRLFLGAFGYPILEPLIKSVTPSLALHPEVNSNTSTEEFTFQGKRFSAQGLLTDEGFVIKKGSTVSKEHYPSMNISVKNLKEQLIADGRLVDEVNHLRLTEDILMSSSSAAADLIAGSSRSGPQSWIDSNGKSLKQRENDASRNGHTSALV